MLIEYLSSLLATKSHYVPATNFKNDIDTLGPGSPTTLIPRLIILVSTLHMSVSGTPSPPPPPKSQPKGEQIQHIQCQAMVSLVRSCTSERCAECPSMGDILDLMGRIQEEHLITCNLITLQEEHLITCILLHVMLLHYLYPLLSLLS